MRCSAQRTKHPTSMRERGAGSRENVHPLEDRPDGRTNERTISQLASPGVDRRTLVHLVSSRLQISVSGVFVAAAETAAAAAAATTKAAVGFIIVIVVSVVLPPSPPLPLLFIFCFRGKCSLCVGRVSSESSDHCLEWSDHALGMMLGILPRNTFTVSHDDTSRPGRAGPGQNPFCRRLILNR